MRENIKIICLALIIGIILFSSNPVKAMEIPEGPLIRAKGDIDVYIVKYVGSKKFKRLILSPHVFESYAHFDKNKNGNKWDDILDIEQSIVDTFVISDLVRVAGDTKVYQLTPQGDVGIKKWINLTAQQFLSKSYDADAIYEINQTDGDAYTNENDITLNSEDNLDHNDNDGDGWQNWYEDMMGTDKNNPDTDGDTVIDSLDEHPLENISSINKIYYITSATTEITIPVRINVPLDRYLMYKSKLRHDFTKNAGNIVDYVIYQDPIIQDIVRQIFDATKTFDYDLLRDLVNQIIYNDDFFTGYDEYPKYPIETLVDGSGDCEDTSILLASLLTAYFYDYHQLYAFIPNKTSPFDVWSASLIVFPEAGHVGVGCYAGDDFPGIPGGFFGYLLNNNEKKYYYIETTSNDFAVGDLPESLEGEELYMYVIDWLEN